jgi:hypothetical protein
MYRFGRQLHAAGLALRRPGITPSEIRDDWLATQLGPIPELPQPLSELPAMFETFELREVVEHVVGILDRLGIPYAVGGSIASSIHGIYRSTVSADLDVEPFPGKEAAFVGAFPPEYYLSLEAIREAIQTRESFNIIQTRTGAKVDVFINKGRPIDRERLARAQTIAAPDAPERRLRIVSPEDIILLKLEWYRLGNEVSERQWTDVVNVLRIQQGRLDEQYLDTGALELGVSDLVEKARRQASGTS